MKQRDQNKSNRSTNALMKSQAEMLFLLLKNGGNPVLCGAIDSALRSLSPQEYKVIVMKFQDGSSNGEIATHLGISNESVRAALFRSLRKIPNVIEAIKRNLHVSRTVLSELYRLNESIAARRPS